MYYRFWNKTQDIFDEDNYINIENMGLLSMINTIILSNKWNKNDVIEGFPRDLENPILLYSNGDLTLEFLKTTSNCDDIIYNYDDIYGKQFWDIDLHTQCSEIEDEDYGPDNYNYRQDDTSEFDDNMELEINISQRPESDSSSGNYKEIES